MATYIRPSIVSTVSTQYVRTTDRSRVMHPTNSNGKSLEAAGTSGGGGGKNGDKEEKADPDVLPNVFVSADKTKRFARIKKLGEGAFCVCYLMEAKIENEPTTMLAGKIFSLGKGCSRKRLERFEREVNIMKSLHHPNIVRFVDAISGVQGNRTLSEFGKRDNVPFLCPPVMIMSYCSGGSLSVLLKARLNQDQDPEYRYGRMKENEVLWVAECCCRALQYIQERRIIHRDIKLGNLLLQTPVSRNGGNLAHDQIGVVLCDFGLATQLQPNQRLIHGTVGTPNYMAPEVVDDDHNNGACFASDIWSLGVTLFHCLTGRPPFQGSKVSGTYRRIMGGEYRWRSVERDHISSGVRHFVDYMLVQNPHKRPTATNVLAMLAKRRQ